jgi:beta-lactamase regulating signal transducer with metallopeptidase domain
MQSLQSFMIALLECSVAMTAIGMLYMAASPFLRKRFAAKGRYYAWLAVIVGLIIPFRFHPSTSVIDVNTLMPVLKHADADRSPIDQAVSDAASTATSMPWYALAGSIWLAGVLAFLSYHAIRHRRFMNMVKRWSTDMADRQALQMLHDVQAKMNITQKVGLRVCPGISTPMLLGVVHPVILLPSDRIPAHELLFVLKHELIHLKRKDGVYKALVFLATALHWFNPFVYAMAREIALQCEISCDEEVVKDTDMAGRRQYAEAIIGMIRKQPSTSSLLVSSFYGGKQGLKNRVLSIMDTRSKKWGISLLTIVILATAGTGAVLKLVPGESETATSEPTRTMTVTGSAAVQKENEPPASSADPVSPADDPVSPADDPEAKQGGIALESGIPEPGIPERDASPLLIPMPEPEPNASNPASGAAERGEDGPAVLFADRVSSGGSPE